MATPSTYTTKRLISPSQLTTGATTLYTVPASTTTQINEIILANDTTSAVTATLHLVPTGGSADDTNIIMKAKSLPTDGTPLIYDFEQLFMSAADTIQGLASAGSQATIHIMGVELT